MKACRTKSKRIAGLRIKKMTLFDLSGIEKKETKENSSGLEALLNAGDAFFNEFSKLSWKEEWEMRKKNFNYAEDFIKEKLNGTEYSAEDIEDYVIIKSAKGTGHINWDEKPVFGAYSGKILGMLTEKNSKEGKKTVVNIDGKGGVFDYLFYMADVFDEVYISNIKGHSICNSMANGNILVLNNCAGNSPANHVGGGWSGGVKEVILNNVKGTNPIRGLAFISGYVELAMLNNSGGDYLQTDFMVASGITERLIIREKIKDISSPQKYSGSEETKTAAPRFTADEYALGVYNDSQIMVADIAERKKETENLHPFKWLIDPNTELTDFLHSHKIVEMTELADKLTSATPDEMQAIANGIYAIHSRTSTEKMIEKRKEKDYMVYLRNKLNEKIPDVLENLKYQEDSQGKEDIYKNKNEKIKSKIGKWLENQWEFAKELIGIRKN
jgi:hypothetical protein